MPLLGTTTLPVLLFRFPFSNLTSHVIPPVSVLCSAKRQERRMVLLGVDNAGKTTTLEQLKALFGLKAMAPERRDIAPGVPLVN